MIIQRVTEYDFVQEFDRMGRADNFSRAARVLLFEHLESLSDDIGENIELDVIEICCYWSEYSEDDLIEQFGHMVDTKQSDSDDIIEELICELENETTVIRVSSDRYLIQDF